MNLLKISRFYPMFPRFFTTFPDFSQRFPDFSLTKFFKVRKCDLCGSLKSAPVDHTKCVIISNKILIKLCISHGDSLKCNSTLRRVLSTLLILEIMKFQGVKDSMRNSKRFSFKRTFLRNI